jgi:ABC-type Fe3+-citrate transport system substrate-binding protein
MKASVKKQLPSKREFNKFLMHHNQSLKKLKKKLAKNSKIQNFNILMTQKSANTTYPPLGFCIDFLLGFK